MRKLFAIVFTLVYSLSSLGLMVNFHYCHDELQQIAFYQNPDNCCCSDTDVPSSCCDNTSLYLYNGEEVQSTTPQIELEKKSQEKALVKTPVPNFTLPGIVPILNIQIAEVPPPQKDRTILYQKLLFYAWLNNCFAIIQHLPFNKRLSWKHINYYY